MVYSLAKGFVHDSIPLGGETFKMMGKKTGAFEATVTDDPTGFTPEKLAEFDAVMMNNTTGDCLPTPEQRKALLDFVKSGKGVAGIHSATDALYKCSEYGEMMGGYFNGHPFGRITVKLDDPTSPINAAFEGKGFDICRRDLHVPRSVLAGETAHPGEHRREKVEEGPGDVGEVRDEALEEPARRRLRLELDPPVRAGPRVLLCVRALARDVLEPGRLAALAGWFAVRVG